MLGLLLDDTLVSVLVCLDPAGLASAGAVCRRFAGLQQTGRGFVCGHLSLC